MPPPSLILFDDATAQAWEPFALTRPAGELLFGALTLRARAERASGLRCALHLSGEHLRSFEEPGAPPVARFADAPREGDRLFWLSRAVVDWGAERLLRESLSREGPLRVGGVVAGWFAPAGTPPPPEAFLREPAADPAPDAAPDVAGRVLENVWELVSGNAEQTARDIAHLHPAPPRFEPPPGAHRFGDHPLVADASARVEPGAVFDTTEGPIWLDRDVTVRAFTRLCGPSYIGPESVVLGGSVEKVSVGPVCRVRGEFTTSVCLGYSNKQHDGHIGHAYLGRWVNIGAGTNNSDLKNNYGSIRIWTPAGDADTGEVKLGSLLGDHVKTGIGLLLNTGTVVGAGSNLYGAAMPPKFVPPFSWGEGSELVEYRLDKFLEVAERAMARRDVELTGPQRAQLRAAWGRGRELWGT